VCDMTQDAIRGQIRFNNEFTSAMATDEEAWWVARSELPRSRHSGVRASANMRMFECGYCYLHMIEEKSRWKAARNLGPFPTVGLVHAMVKFCGRKTGQQVSFEKTEDNQYWHFRVFPENPISETAGDFHLQLLDRIISRYGPNVKVGGFPKPIDQELDWAFPGKPKSIQSQFPSLPGSSTWTRISTPVWEKRKVTLVPSPKPSKQVVRAGHQSDWDDSFWDTAPHYDVGNVYTNCVRSISDAVQTTLERNTFYPSRADAAGYAINRWRSKLEKLLGSDCFVSQELVRSPYWANVCGVFDLKCTSVTDCISTTEARLAVSEAWDYRKVSEEEISVFRDDFLTPLLSPVKPPKDVKKIDPVVPGAMFKTKAARKNAARRANRRARAVRHDDDEESLTPKVNLPKKITPILSSIPLIKKRPVSVSAQTCEIFLPFEVKAVPTVSIPSSSESDVDSIISCYSESSTPITPISSSFEDDWDDSEYIANSKYDAWYAERTVLEDENPWL